MKDSDDTNDIFYEIYETPPNDDRFLVPMGNGTVGIAIAWAPILAAAAKALAAAIATSIGEAIGEKLKNAIIGSNDNFQIEVIKRLDRIEGKLDGVISLIRYELPDQIKKNVDQGFIDDAKVRLKNARISVDSAILLSKSDIGRNRDNLLSVGRNVAELGGYLIQRGGWPYTLSAIHAMTSALSIFSRLARINQGDIKGIAPYAKGYLDILVPLVDEKNPDNLFALKKHLEDELAWAKENFAFFSTKPVEYITSVFFNPGNHTAAGSVVTWAVVDGHRHNDGTIDTWFASEDSSWNIVLVKPVHNVDELRKHLNDRNRTLEGKGKDHNPIIAPWWTPGIYMIGDSHNYYADATSSFIWATRAAEYVNHHPGRIAEVNFAIELIMGKKNETKTGLLEACKLLSSL